MNRGPDTTDRLQQRAEREARKAGSAPPRPPRERGTAVLSTRPRRGLQVSPVMLAVIGGGLALIVLLVYAVTQVDNTRSGPPEWVDAQLDESTRIPGTFVAPHPGPDGVFDSATNSNSDDRRHFANGTIVPLCTAEQIEQKVFNNPICYQSNPPTSGPHAASPMPFRVLENPAPKENLVHNMEHGGVVVWVNTANQAVYDQLADLVRDELDKRRFVVMTRYAEMEPETIALTSWTRLEKMSTANFDKDEVRDFITTNERRFNPEGF